MRKRPKCEKSRLVNKNNWSPAGADYGAFLVPFNGEELRVISSGRDVASHWEHVSVSLDYRCPTWPEMCFIKNKFWHPEEAVIQFHPPESKGINVHNFCLHMWRPIDVQVIMPPQCCV